MRRILTYIAVAVLVVLPYTILRQKADNASFERSKTQEVFRDIENGFLEPVVALAGDGGYRILNDRSNFTITIDSTGSGPPDVKQESDTIPIGPTSGYNTLSGFAVFNYEALSSDSGGAILDSSIVRLISDYEGYNSLPIDSVRVAASTCTLFVHIQDDTILQSSLFLSWYLSDSASKAPTTTVNASLTWHFTLK